MKRFIVFLVACMLLTSGLAYAADTALSDDIRKEQIFGRSDNIVGSGSVYIQTGLTDKENIMMSFGGTIRMIPTAEKNYDFGLGEKPIGFTFATEANALGTYLASIGDPFSNAALLQGISPGWLLGALPQAEFWRRHLNEAGALADSYIRSENKLYFNAMPKDKKWSFYAALEYDAALDNGSVDARGGRDSTCSNFGLERLHGTMALPFGMRFHAGWDVWHIDGFDGGGLVYGDDNPGFWVTGKTESLEYNLAYIKLWEDDWEGMSATGLSDLDVKRDDDRDLYAAQVDWFSKDRAHKIKAFYLFDRIRNAQSLDLLAMLTLAAGVPNLGIQSLEETNTNAYHAGAYYVGKYGNLEIMGEGVYHYGRACDTGLYGQTLVGTDLPIRYNDFDIKAYAFAADMSYELNGALKSFYSLKPHLGYLYTSGDDDATDSTLGGYNGVANAQRYSMRWGGENTIVGDTNFVFGSLLYGYVPEFYGNGTPVFSGGVFANYGAGRGDNPGLSMLSAGITIAPKIFLSYKTNLNMFKWNEAFTVTSFVDTATNTRVSSGYVGSEWDNELTLALSRHHFIRAQASMFFPGAGIKDVTEALSASTNLATGERIPGEKCNEKARRLAMELIWNF